MFKGKPAAAAPRPETPEALYLNGGLGRSQKAVPGLWVHQGDVLRSYAADHQQTTDLAIELPTGTGKTLPGLLIGDWVRRGGERVAFATPTTQLAAQVVATAREEASRSSSSPAPRLGGTSPIRPPMRPATPSR